MIVTQKNKENERWRPDVHSVLKEDLSDEIRFEQELEMGKQSK